MLQSCKGYYYKAKLELVDNTLLFIKEYISSSEHAYSYHWQDKNGELLIRWDNAPHHETIKTSTIHT
ncbi:MAG: hypothetical protein JW891_13660 [Candidatus Lokiarchaeota archaeon]|nr:hypothetical protein [Candidatus Lokiarchaeota archaeon]